MQITSLVLGKPYREPIAIELPTAALSEYVGVYKIDQTNRRYVTVEGTQLYSQRSDCARLELFAYTTDKFFTLNNFSRFYFLRDENGMVRDIQLLPHFGLAESATRVNESPPRVREPIELYLCVLGNYIEHPMLVNGSTIPV